MGIKQSERDFPRLTREAAGVIASVLERDRRVLLFGAPGVGKSTLVTWLAKRLAQAQRNCWCISADPGSPLMGVPGAVTLGHWQQDAWQVDDYAALCTLDAGRFRLPLVSAVRRLLKQSFDGVMLVDGPGVARGVAGSELLEGLAEATRAHVVLVITPTGKTPPLVDELRTLKQEVYLISAAEAAMRPGKRVRARARTAQWDGYLHTGITQSIDLDSVHVIGTPPPREEASVWTGRQIALIQAQHTLAMGEVQQLEGNQLTVTLPERVSGADTLLIRDAARTADGVIETAAPWTTERLHYLQPVDVLPSITVNNGPRLVGRVGSVEVALIGVILDHQGTEVVAYAFEPDRQINVRKDRLVARGLEPGPWLKELKQQLLCGNETATICLPDGSDASVAALATELLLISPGKKLVYATDLADTADNRQRLIGLATKPTQPGGTTSIVIQSPERYTYLSCFYWNFFLHRTKIPPFLPQEHRNGWTSLSHTLLILPPN